MVCGETPGELVVAVLEQAALTVLAQERKVLVLSVNVHEERGETAQKTDGHMAAVDEDGALTRARNLTHDDQLFFLTVNLLLRKNCGEFPGIRMERKDCLHAQSVASAADRVR